MVDKLIHFHQGFVHHFSAQIQLHTRTAAALGALHMAAARAHLVGLACLTGLLLGSLLLIRGFQIAQRHLGFQNSGTHFHKALTVRQCHHHSALAHVCNFHFLANAHLCKRSKLGALHTAGLTRKQFFGISAGDLSRTDRTLAGCGFFVLLQLAQFIGKRVGFLLDLLHHFACFLAGSLQLGFPLLNQLFPLFTSAFQCVGRLRLGLLGLGLTGLELQLQIVQLAEHAVQTLIIVGKMRARHVDHFCRHAQTLADQKCVGFTGHAHTQLIGGAQRFHIKFAAGIYHAGRFKCKHFELCIMRGSQDQRTLTAQRFDHCHSQRRTLGRVGSGAKFIQQHQCAAAGQL